jgi:hypothetical protein
MHSSAQTRSNRVGPISAKPLSCLEVLSSREPQKSLRLSSPFTLISFSPASRHAASSTSKKRLLLLPLLLALRILLLLKSVLLLLLVSLLAILPLCLLLSMLTPLLLFRRRIRASLGEAKLMVKGLCTMVSYWALSMTLCQEYSNSTRGTHQAF